MNKKKCNVSAARNETKKQKRQKTTKTKQKRTNLNKFVTHPQSKILQLI